MPSLPGNSGFERFLEDPPAWWREQERHQAEPERAAFPYAIEKAEPNSGHYALAHLEHPGVLKLSITQNFDDLHYAVGSRRVAEIHGNRTELRCIGCESRLAHGRDRFRQTATGVTRVWRAGQVRHRLPGGGIPA